MIAIARDGVGRVGEEELRVLGFDLKILRGLPEVVEDHHAVFVGKVVERRLGVVAHPIADHVHVGFPLKAEVGFELGAAEALHRIVHAPAAAARGDAHAVDAQGEVGERDGGRDGADGRGFLTRRRQALRPAERGLLDGGVADVDQREFAGLRIGGIDFDAAQAAIAAEQ
jgi:hypothetical protein